MRNAWWLGLVMAGCAAETTVEPMSEEAPVSRAHEPIEVEGFAPNPGNVRLFFFAPSAPKPGAGLVVALHGCLQTAADFQRVGWNALGEANGFYVLYVQASSANGCFRWFEPAHATRGQGEAASVVAGVDWVLQRYAVDRRRVFVTGLSAGAAMSVALLAAAPDVFSAGAVFAGVPAGCAKSSSEGVRCMSGVDLSSTEWAQRAQGVVAVNASNAPRVQVWTGDADTTVSPSMAGEIVEQFAALHGVAPVAVEREQFARVTSEVFGKGEVQKVTIAGFGHAVPVATSASCGASGPFVTEAGVCGAREAAKFFGLLEAAPVPSPVEPTADAGVVTVEVDAGVNAPSCKESLASPTWHVWMWHAEVCGFFNSLACAKGSMDLLGSTYSSVPVWAYSADGDTWHAGRCP